MIRRPTARRAAMPSRALAPLLAGCAAACAVACAEAPPVPFRVIAAAPDDPFFGSDALVVALERDGAPVAGTERRFAPGAERLELDGLPFGERLAIRVETRIGDVVLGRGRSFPFDYVDPASPPASADVLIGTLGRFVRTLDAAPPGVPRAIAAHPRGAVIATDRELVLYGAHDDSGRAALAPIAAVPAARVGALWAVLGDRLLAAGGASPGASVIELDGTVRGELELPPVVALGSLPGRDAALAIAEDRSIVRLDVDALGAIASVAIGRVADAPLEPMVIPVDVVVGGREVPFAVIADGARATLVDPDAGAVATLDLGSARVGRVALALGPQLVMLAGGRDAMYPTIVYDDVALLVAQAEPAPSLAWLSPAPPRMFRARSHGAAIRIGEGLALIAGGRDAEPLAGAEIVQIDPPPGRVDLAQPMPFALAGPRGALLADRTVLIAGAEGIAVYVPPRE